MNQDFVVCKLCSDNIKKIYQFRIKCLISKTAIIEYVNTQSYDDECNNKSKQEGELIIEEIKTELNDIKEEHLSDQDQLYSDANDENNNSDGKQATY